MIQACFQNTSHQGFGVFHRAQTQHTIGNGKALNTLYNKTVRNSAFQEQRLPGSDFQRINDQGINNPIINNPPFDNKSFRNEYTDTPLDSLQLQAFAWISSIVPEAELLTLAVAPKAQRQGLGRFLLTHILSQLKQQGIQQMFLEVRASNTSAQALYHSLGFAQYARRTNYYSATSFTPQEEAVCMRLNFPSS